MFENNYVFLLLFLLGVVFAFLSRVGVGYWRKGGQVGRAYSLPRVIRFLGFILFLLLGWIGYKYLS